MAADGPHWLAPILVALLAYGVVGLLVGRAGRLGLVHAPNARSSHSQPTPHGGGLGIVVAGLAGAVWLAMSDPRADIQLLPIAGLSLAIAGLGLWDDIRPMPAAPRLLAHTLACLGALWWLDVGAAFGLAAFGLFWFAGVWWLNLFNFMDGIDGLAGAQALFMALAAALLAALVTPEAAGHPVWRWLPLIAAACVGFLGWNWPPARIFMGDVGSTWLGFVLFGVALATMLESWLTAPVWLILGALFIADASLTLLRRMARGEAWTQAHRSHAYQRLARRWHGHRPVTVLALSINLLYLLPLAFAALHWPDFAWALVALAYAPLIVAILTIRSDGPD